ncbi:2-oxoglutarate (2OG) and Fe(II)-dependent oxygenase superfamily protein [Rhynchospora pubera]|uniref:2-oxoglutarate (2OG) and Fe(II)-dependent oxygenase superfamily protein n=1 Tax=Rhynchospora pubera TaxID=906938 RepID=A0AAV8CPD5_9POAL|nr:2-oxoglutarate (2OG) and Fe(II)-dependent oxygenase superfamily protein [Rhynchospora pubera]
MEAALPPPPLPQRVQTLSESGLANLPSSYIQPPSLRPQPHSHSHSHVAPPGPSIPTIDLSSSDPAPQVRRACAEWGAFHVINHGVPPSLLNEMRSIGAEFFQSPVEQKTRFSCDLTVGPAAQGYGSRMLARDDTVLDWRDYFDHHTLPLDRRDPTKWPDFIPNYREVVTQYSNEMERLAKRLLSIISQSLNLPPSYIQDAVGDVYQNITVSFYPPCPRPDLALGLQAHSDMGAITLLIQDDVGGLEVLKDDQWVLVQPLEDAIVVILADMTEIMTNGAYKSSVHRALVNANKARLSVATFYDPSKVCKIHPAPPLITAENRAKYKEVVYGDFVRSWYGQGPEGKRNIDALLIQ